MHKHVRTPATSRNRRRRLYGLSDEKYKEMCEVQDARCAICKVRMRDLDKSLCIDHNHETGQLRGLLCSHCNSGLGLFKDNAVLLRAAAKYLCLWKASSLPSRTLI